MEYLTLVNAILNLAETLVPAIEAAVKSGQISVADQQALQARIAALHQSTAFTGREWDQSTTTSPTSQASGK